MSSGDTMTRDESCTAVPKWTEEASTLDSFEERVQPHRGALSLRTASHGTAAQK